MEQNKSQTRNYRDCLSAFKKEEALKENFESHKLFKLHFLPLYAAFE